MQQIKHTIPMLRIATLDASADAFRHCQDMLRMGARSISAEVKLDGLTCDLTYRDGKLQLAAMRGPNTLTGLDVTDVARTVDSIPGRIPQSAGIVIRGVMVLPVQATIDHASSFANPLNSSLCVQEAMSVLHPAHGRLEYVMCDYVAIDQSTSVPNAHTFISKFVHIGSCRTVLREQFTESDFRNMLARVNTIKHSNRYDSRGIVFKIRNMLGGSEGAEFYSGMFLVPETRVTTQATVRRAWYSVSKSGKLTPHWVVEENGQSHVCNLHNIRNAKRCGQTVGDTILIDRHGNGQPIVRGLYKLAGGEDLGHDVKTCPECGHDIVYMGYDPHCHNTSCRGRGVSMLRFILGKGMFNAQRVSESQLSVLWGMICKINYPAQLALFRVPVYELSHELYETIQRHRTLPLYKALALLNLPALSLVAMKNIAQSGRSLQNIFAGVQKMRNDREREIMAEWYANPENSNLVKRLDGFFVYGNPSNVAYDRNICISGRFAANHSAMIKKINAKGYSVHSCLSPNTSAILAGEAAGSIVYRAANLGIPVVSTIEALDSLC